MAKRAIVALLALLAFAGCATAPKPVQFDPIAQSADTPTVRASAVNVTNAAPTHEFDGPGMYRSGLNRVDDKMFQPSAGAQLEAQLEQLRTTPGGPVVEVTILDTAYFYEKNAGDEIVFISIANAFRDHGFTCTADLLVKRAGAPKAERLGLEATTGTLNLATEDSLLRSLHIAVPLCQRELVRKAAAAL